MKLLTRLKINLTSKNLKILIHNLHHQTKIIKKQDEILRQFIAKSNSNEPHDWKNLKEQVFLAGNTINKINFDANFIGFCVPEKRLDLANEYFNYLISNQMKPNNATIGKLLKLYSICYNNKPITPQIQEDIYQLCNLIETKDGIVDAFTSENIIIGLSLTENWHKCLKYLESIKFTAKPSSTVYSAIISAAFRHNESDLAWKLLNIMLDDERIPILTMYEGFLNYYHKNGLKEETLEHLFVMFNKNDIKPPKEFVDHLIVLKNIKVELTKINHKGKCEKCNNVLKRLELSKEEFDLLRNGFFYNVIIGKNVYTKTTPEELDTFKTFIANEPKFDIVIDGLNIAYSAGINKSPIIYCKMISSVIEYFQKKHKKVLVLGRVHMKNWKNKYMNFILQNSSLFLTQNLSQDDPFLLYATMYSGPNTGFISRDLMRNHAFKLHDPQLKILFNQWQNSVQYQLIYVNDNGRVAIKNPLSYIPSAQKYNNYWHIPFSSNDNSVPIASELNWICIQTKPLEK